MLLSIEKLRMAKCEGLPCFTCQTLADEIEREIAEKYMELPVDAEGVPIHVGDKVTLTDKPQRRVFIVSAVGATKSGNPVFHGYEENGDHLERHRIGINTRHVKPRTIEDVLAEFGRECVGASIDETNALLAKYADELRSMGVGE